MTLLLGTIFAIKVCVTVRNHSIIWKGWNTENNEKEVENKFITYDKSRSYEYPESLFAAVNEIQPNPNPLSEYY